MTSHRIADVVQSTGIPATTLRYYDEIGLAPASQRSEAGYRLYDERSLERLRFIARAKELGLGLADIKTLTELWDGGECGPVQQEMARLVDARLVEIAERNRELVAFADQLRTIAARLGTEPHAGACSDSCTCVASAQPAPVPIACTLETADDISQRVEDWQAVLARAIEREAVDGGIRLRFPADAATAADLGRLAALEVGCCGWLDFSLAVSAGTMTLDVRAPEEGTDVMMALFG